jgi:hypothetical protein
MRNDARTGPGMLLYASPSSVRVSQQALHLSVLSNDSSLPGEEVKPVKFLQCIRRLDPNHFDPLLLISGLLVERW